MLNVFTLFFQLKRRTWENQPAAWIYPTCLVAALVSILGLGNSIFLADSAYYATIAKTMVVKGNYWELFVNGYDWLDKPHFPFWMAALSFNVFGINSLAYKLPALLFSFLGVFYTFKLARELYNIRVAIFSSLILLSSLHFIISNNDVRAEAYLTGLLVASVYHFVKLKQRFQFRHMFLASLFAAGAVMTKGIFVLILIASAIGGDMLFRRTLVQLLKWRWLWSFLLILILITPELYALYFQFDAHPEKIIYGRQNVSGLRFFFWDSQFGRFFNTGPITKAGADPFFFAHTLIWAFFPWALFLFAGVFRKGKTLFQIKKGLSEYYCFSISLFTFILFSVSQFQLSHYLNIVFPFFSILVATLLSEKANDRVIKIFSNTQYFLLLLFLLAALVVHIVFQPGRMLVLFFLLGFLLLWVLSLPRFKVEGMEKLIYLSVGMAIFLGAYMNLIFYPKLLQYQSGIKAAQLHQNAYADYPLAAYGFEYYPVDSLGPSGKPVFSYPFEFYASSQPMLLTAEKLKEQMGDEALAIYLPSQQVPLLRQNGVHIIKQHDFEHFHITKVTLPFLNLKSRSAVLEERSLILARRIAE